MAMDLYGELLRDPLPIDWSIRNMEALAALSVPHDSWENWFLVALEHKDHDTALEISDRARRHRFFSSLGYGGRLESLRWILESPKRSWTATPSCSGRVCSPPSRPTRSLHSRAKFAPAAELPRHGALVGAEGVDPRQAREYDLEVALVARALERLALLLGPRQAAGLAEPPFELGGELEEMNDVLPGVSHLLL